MKNLDLITKSALMSPSRVVEPLWWVGHIPFVMWLVENLKPQLLVELGTHSGNSYFAMCNSVNVNKLPTRCYAVDTWQGDLHQGTYENDIYLSVKEFNDKYYREFSELLRMTFDEALPRFVDGTVDLLHIDGLHTYEAVRHDFETWLPKLSNRAVVIFHDTVVKKLDFGVWRLWEELSAKYPSIHFEYSQGLGVLFVGERQSSVIHEFLNLWATPGGQSSVHQFFHRIGQSVEFEYMIANPNEAILKREAEINSLRQLITNRDEQIAHMNQVVIERNGQIADYNKLIAERDEMISENKQGLAKQDKVISELSLAVVERDAQISRDRYKDREHQELIVELRKNIDDYRTSKSWRMTKPLRKFSLLHWRFIRLIKITNNYRKTYPGINGLARLIYKTIEVIRDDGVDGLRKKIQIQEIIRGTISKKRSSTNLTVMLEEAAEPASVLHLDVGVHAHVYYTELASELRSYLENIPVKFHLYVTTDTKNKADLIEKIFAGMGNVSVLDVRIVENRGRDIASMVGILGAELASHEIVLHVHTKRSPHNAILRGWRRYLLESLLGNQKRVTSILQQFVQTPSLGILFPKVFNPVRPCMNIGGNQRNMEKLLEKGGKRKSAIKSVSKDFFPAGSMFWFRGKAIEPFVNMKLTAEDFDPEMGQSDATLAHAIERMFVYFADDRGLKSWEYSTHQFDPDSGVSGFDWFRYYITTGKIKNPIVIFDHNYGGGTNTYSNILANSSVVNGNTVLKCVFKNNYWFVEWVDVDDGMIFATLKVDELFETLALTGCKKIIVNSLYGYKDISRVADLLVILAQSIDATLDYKVHDFYGICPSPHLLNFKNEYCAVPQDHKTCELCLKKNKAWYIKDSWTDNIDEWRRPFGSLLKASTTIDFFDRTTIDIHRKAFYLEDDKINITPHDDKYFECGRNMDLSSELHIGVLGTLTMVKGGAIINALCNYIGEENLKIPITVVGTSMLPTDPRINVLGSYEVNELPGIVRENRINVIFISSIVPETFSFTISEAIKMGLPIVAFDIGAQGNRVKQYKLGKVIPLGSTPGVILTAIHSILKEAQEFYK
ncbi:MAG: rhamnan synthesis F family protein [Limnohabitans sp.]|uniref:rhamnan synthesis F family protein n=1 Tax=Limnohabitans sp. TaxID=1907725 RepID=UPI003C77911A